MSASVSVRRKIQTPVHSDDEIEVKATAAPVPPSTKTTKVVKPKPKSKPEPEPEPEPEPVEEETVIDIGSDLDDVDDVDPEEEEKTTVVAETKSKTKKGKNDSDASSTSSGGSKKPRGFSASKEFIKKLPALVADILANSDPTKAKQIMKIIASDMEDSKYFAAVHQRISSIRNDAKAEKDATEPRNQTPYSLYIANWSNAKTQEPYASILQDPKKKALALAMYRSAYVSENPVKVPTDAPKKYANAWGVFAEEYRIQHQRNDANGKKISIPVKEVSAAWKGLSEEQKKPYVEKFEKSLIAYSQWLGKQQKSTSGGEEVTADDIELDD